MGAPDPDVVKRAEERREDDTDQESTAQTEESDVYYDSTTDERTDESDVYYDSTTGEEDQ